MYNTKMWRLTDTTRKLYYIDKTTTPNIEIIKKYGCYNPRPTYISIKEEIRQENLKRIKLLKVKKQSFKPWKT
jgi:hypothetical protein